VSKLLQEEFNYFKSHLQELYEKYPGKFIVIKYHSVIGVYNDFDTALIETLKTEHLGDFLIQKCEADPDLLQFIFTA